MELGVEKYAMLIMMSGKRKITEAIELPNQERIGSFGTKIRRTSMIGSGQANIDKRKNKKSWN